MNVINKLINNSWADAEIIDLSYLNNDILTLKIKNYKEEISEFEIKNIFKLFFEDYLNDDISEIKGELLDDVYTISIISASTDKEIIKFSFFID